MPQFEVLFYDRPDGKEPAKEFMLSLDPKLRAKLAMAAALLADNGPQLREPYSKALGDGIFELRAKSGSDICRVLYFFVIGRRIVLTNGFIKKSQKIPSAELTLAKQYRQEFLSRKEP